MSKNRLGLIISQINAILPKYYAMLIHLLDVVFAQHSFVQFKVTSKLSHYIKFSINF